MHRTHEVAPGESLASIASEYGLLPETIWNDPENSELRRKCKHSDHLVPGDALKIREVETKTESRPTEQRHRFVRKGNLGVVLRLEMDPGQARDSRDRFVLSSSDGSYNAERTVKDDLVPGDNYIDLYYSGLRAKKQYSLRIYASGSSDPCVVFENLPYEQLAGLSGSSSDQPAERQEPASGAGAAGGIWEEAAEAQEQEEEEETAAPEEESGTMEEEVDAEPQETAISSGR